jgi:SAM-dependent methyltransferase
MKHDTDQKIYAAIQEELPKIKPFLSELRYALPALFAQKKEMAKETLQLLANDKPIEGFVEIGSTGRYASHLKKHYDISNLYFIHDVAPNFSPVDIAERGSLTKYGQFIPFNNYQEINENQIKNESIELIICYIGLHHCPPEKLASFVQSLYRILKPGGSLILRDHDVKTPQMHAFVSLVHAVFNAGLGISWENNQKELRHFNSLAYWIQYLEKFGFKTNGQTILQDYDPSLNTLIRFVK